MFKDLLDSLKAQLYERAVSPLLGSFVLSWLLWNYKLVLVVLSEESVLEKFRIIDEVLYYDWKQTFCITLGFPLITAIFYIFIYPYPAKWVFKFTRKRQVEINQTRKEIEGNVLLSVDESREIRSRIFKLEDAHQEALNRKSEEIERLKAELHDKNHEDTDGLKEGPDLETQKSEGITTTLDLDKEQVNMLVMIADGRSSCTREELVRKSGSSKIKAEYDLDRLEERGLIKYDYDMRYQESMYVITKKGRSFLVDKNLHNS